MAAFLHSGNVLTAIDRLAGSKQCRSGFIERVLRQFLRERIRARGQNLYTPPARVLTS